MLSLEDSILHNHGVYKKGRLAKKSGYGARGQRAHHAMERQPTSRRRMG